MARMYPADRPESSSSAELSLYDAFRRLPDGYRVFHGVRWRRREPGRQLLDERGEVDFAVLHPRFGLLLLEAKGGKIRRDGESGKWYSEDGAGVEHNIDDPFAQVDDNLYAMADQLREGVSTRRFFCPVRSGVAFIQTVVRGPIALHAPRSSVIDSTDLADLEAAVERLYGTPLKEPLSKEAVEAVTDLLSPTVLLTKVGLNARFEEIERARLEPTESQRWLLDHFDRTPRAMVEGCAGSGKTLLALELARRLARSGHEVLYLCFNRRLALWANTAVSDGSFPAGRVKVKHFHGLAEEACAAAGMRLFDNQDFPDWEAVPQRMEAALALAPMQFDAVVVDEGQDFRSDWWLIVMSELLRRPDEDPLYVFFDPNQRIYSQRLELPDQLPVYPLTANLRNTRQIHAEVVRYFQGDTVPRSEGPDGVEVMRISEPTVKGVQRALDELMNQQKVPSSQVIVLTGRAQEKSDLKEGRRLGNLGLTWHPPKAGEVQVATVQAFKGLEKQVVVLAEVDHLLRDDGKRLYGEALLYIGASRAVNHLVLVGAQIPGAETPGAETPAAEQGAAS